MDLRFRNLYKLLYVYGLFVFISPSVAFVADTFCMIVRSCYVDDTFGNKVDLVDVNGCAEDLYLLNNPEYVEDLKAGVEAHVFKYAGTAITIPLPIRFLSYPLSNS